MNRVVLIPIIILSIIYFSCKKDSDGKGKEKKAVVSTLSGGGVGGWADGQGVAARFNFPQDVCSDANGNIYVADTYNHRIRKITPTGIVTTIAGSISGFAEGQGDAAQFNYPNGISMDAQGNIYVADTYNYRIRKITPSGMVSTFAGDGTEGYAEGQGTAAKFYYPIDTYVDAQGNVFVSDLGNNRVRKITSGGMVSTFAGDGSSDWLDGQGVAAKIGRPAYITGDADGNLYVNQEYRRIRKITQAGAVSTLLSIYPNPGYADGQLGVARFNQFYGVAAHNSDIFLMDDNRVRKISADAMVSTLAGNGTTGYVEGKDTTARFNDATGLCMDKNGSIYVADFRNHCIRKIDFQ
jgi:sugar lactone lactonase YvrE